MRKLLLITLLLIFPGPLRAEGDEERKVLEEKARAALIAFVNDVILNKNNREGDAIRAAVLDHREPADRERAEQEIVAQAQAFPALYNKQNQPQPWRLETSKNPEKPCQYYTGRLFGLATEIEFDPAGDKVTRIFVEVD